MVVEQPIYLLMASRASVGQNGRRVRIHLQPLRTTFTDLLEHVRLKMDQKQQINSYTYVTNGRIYTRIIDTVCNRYHLNKTGAWYLHYQTVLSQCLPSHHPYCLKLHIALQYMHTKAWAFNSLRHPTTSPILHFLRTCT